MATTDFVDGVTLTAAAWFDDVDTAAYSYLTSVSGTNTVAATGPASLGAYAAGQRFRFLPAVTNTAATTLNITPSGSSALGAKSIFSGGVSLRGGELVANLPVDVVYDGTQFNLVASGSMAPMVDPKVCDGRLTLTSGTAVTTTDVTGAETIYLTPYKGNKLALYTGATWKLYTFAEVSGDVPDAAQMNDVFVYDNAGTLTLDIVAWTNDTTRATALALQDGVYVKTGALGRRYVGSFYSNVTGNGQTEDSLANRFVWNYYNRVLRKMKRVDTTNSWAWSTASWQQANASTANQLNFIVGVSEDVVTATAHGGFTTDGATVRTAFTGIGLDATNAQSADLSEFGYNGSTGTLITMMMARYSGYPGIGKHFLAWLEFGGGGDIQTWFGDNNTTAAQTGILGEIWA